MSELPSAALLAQPILQTASTNALFVTFTIREGAEAETVAALGEVTALIRAVGFRGPDEGLNCVVGIGAELWDRLYDLPRPAGLHPFQPLDGGKHRAPATAGDLFFHIRSRRFDLCFELAHRLVDAFATVTDSVEQVQGFRYFDQRDLLGFVDGTENPDGLARLQSVVIPDGPWAGGSYLVVQKYLHDLDAWNAISTEEQQRVIGRTKLDDIELPDDVKPTNSHVALNTLYDADGNQRQILRDNLAFGSVAEGEFGTFFISYAADVTTTELMLQQMFLGKPEGNYDRILDFSTAVTGCLFFVPPVEFLDDPNSVTLPAPPAPSAAAPAAPTDGSLGIGSLKGQS